MDHRQYLRDPVRVQSYLRELEDERLVTTKGCKIVIPARFAERELAYIGTDTRIVGIFAMIVEDKYYAVSVANAMMRITPSATVKVEYDGDEYYEFSFDAGATVVASTQLVQTDTLVYSIYNEILAKGRVPWYMGYEEMAGLFDTAKHHASAKIGQNQEITELIVSIIGRNDKDRHMQYRHLVQSYEQISSNPPAFIPLRSVTYAASNTLNKIAGSYARDGMVSALVTPTDRVERIEDILRR